MKKNIRLFILFSRFAMKTTTQARMGIVFFMLGKVLRFVFIFALIALIFSRTQALKGYTFEQTAIFFLTYNIIDSLAQVLFREVYRFRYSVVSGSFDLTLLKPHHPFLRILVGGVDLLDLMLVIPYALILLYMALRLPHVTAGTILLFLVFLLNSLILATAFHIIILALAILTTEVDHTIMIYRDVTGLARMPMEIYKEPVKTVFTFVIPVGIMMAVPAQALIGSLTLPVAFISFVCALAVCLFAIYLWNGALFKYQSYGG